MQINLSVLVPGIDGKPIKMGNEDATVKKAILLSLAAPSTKQSGSNPDDVVKIWRLFRKIDSTETEVDLKSDEIVLIKKIVSERLASEVIAGFVICHIEPEKD